LFELAEDRAQVSGWEDVRGRLAEGQIAGLGSDYRLHQSVHGLSGKHDQIALKDLEF
jgi:hypothetical protein